MKKGGWFQGDSSPRHRFLRPRTELAACWPNESLSPPPPPAAPPLPWCTPSPWCSSSSSTSTCWTDQPVQPFVEAPAITDFYYYFFLLLVMCPKNFNLVLRADARPQYLLDTFGIRRRVSSSQFFHSAIISARFFPWMDNNQPLYTLGRLAADRVCAPNKNCCCSSAVFC